MAYWMMHELAGNRGDDAEDLARLWRPLLLKAAARAAAHALIALLNLPGAERHSYPRFELSDRALHDIGLNRSGATRGRLRPLGR